MTRPFKKETGALEEERGKGDVKSAGKSSLLAYMTVLPIRGLYSVITLVNTTVIDASAGLNQQSSTCMILTHTHMHVLKNK